MTECTIYNCCEQSTDGDGLYCDEHQSPRSPGCSLADAFRAGAQWAARNGSDNWLKLDGVAEHYEETGEVKDFPGFVVHEGFSE